MFISYADESGYSGRKFDQRQPVQVFAAILPNAYNIHRTRKEFNYNLEILRKNKIKIKELKASEIYRGKRGWADIRAETRHGIFERYFQWLQKRKHKIIVSIIDQKSFFSAKNKIKKLLKVPYVAGALHIALTIQKIHNNAKANKGKTILIFDEQKEYQNDVSKLIAEPNSTLLKFYKINKKDSPLEQIIDTAYFNSSHYSYLLQVADTTAFVYRRYYELKNYKLDESYLGEKEKIENWIKIIDRLKVSESTMYPKKTSQRICKFFNCFLPK